MQSVKEYVKFYREQIHYIALVITKFTWLRIYSRPLAL
jgi:hypothetical protein